LEHWIEHPAEPRELILAWQPPSSVSDRFRWAVGRIAHDQGGVVFDYFDDQSFPRYNAGRSIEQLRQATYAGYPAFDLKKRPEGGYRDYALEAFLRRLPPTSRSDFGNYLAYFCIPQATRMSPLALLAATEARLPSDGFSLINPLDPLADCVEVVLEIAGFRHYRNNAPNLTLDDPLQLEPEPSNRHDPGAVRITSRGRTIGYVNRLQAPTARTWLTSRTLQCWVARLNGRPEAPRAFAFLQVRPAAHVAAAA
jgi:hypothetical protein